MKAFFGMKGFQTTVLRGGLALVCVGGAMAEEAGVDALSGLKMSPGWELVRNNCITCHSAKQFLQQRGTRTTWDHIITWMQERAGLWPLAPEVREAILDYLAENHGPGESFRRPPIPAHLMPMNPYVSSIRRDLEGKERLKVPE